MELPALDSIKRTLAQPNIAADRQVAGPALQVLHSFLKEADPSQHWGDLHKTPTPDGNILWLCAEHRLPYEVCWCWICRLSRSLASNLLPG